MKLTGIGEVPLKMYSSPLSTRHHRCVLTNITKYFRFSETKRINLNNIDTWLVNSFGFRILELGMATNESFEIGVQISSNPISAFAVFSKSPILFKNYKYNQQVMITGKKPYLLRTL